MLLHRSQKWLTVMCAAFSRQSTVFGLFLMRCWFARCVISRSYPIRNWGQSWDRCWPLFISLVLLMLTSIVCHPSFWIMILWAARVSIQTNLSRLKTWAKTTWLRCLSLRLGTNVCYEPERNVCPLDGGTCRSTHISTSPTSHLHLCFINNWTFARRNNVLSEFLFIIT